MAQYNVTWTHLYLNFMCLKFNLGKLDPSTPCVMSLTKEKLTYEHERDQTEMELCSVLREY